MCELSSDLLIVRLIGEASRRADKRRLEPRNEAHTFCGLNSTEKVTEPGEKRADEQLGDLAGEAWPRSWKSLSSRNRIGTWIN